MKLVWGQRCSFEIPKVEADRPMKSRHSGRIFPISTPQCIGPVQQSVRFLGCSFSELPLGAIRSRPRCPPIPMGWGEPPVSRGPVETPPRQPWSHVRLGRSLALPDMGPLRIVWGIGMSSIQQIGEHGMGVMSLAEQAELTRPRAIDGGGEEPGRRPGRRQQATPHSRGDSPDPSRKSDDPPKELEPHLCLSLLLLWTRGVHTNIGG